MNPEQLNLHQPIGDTVKTTTCYMCACRCGIKVHLKDGKVRYIEGNRDHLVNQGVICAKGSAGIMQHYSPARLQSPMLRVGERGEGKFKAISWDEALKLATGWLRDIRNRNPNELAFFTGRDQSQALTGWWAQQFGTVNYAAHGGFCSVNMAAAGMYTLGSSFWEFGEPDWHHCQYLMLWGVAEDHDSNPIKINLGKLKQRGVKIVAINPVRTGYAAIADEWVPIRPGTDGLLIGALIHELLRRDAVDLDYLVRYTNAHHLVIDDPDGAEHGLIYRDASGEALCFDCQSQSLRPALATDVTPALVGDYQSTDGRRLRPSFHLLAERFLDTRYAPAQVAEQCDVPVAVIHRLADELIHAAFQQAVTLPIQWTDYAGRQHETMTGRPVAMHAMRGIAAHSNGFHTCRMLHVLQMLLGAIETPGSFRFQPPYPKGIPPANRPGKTRNAAGVLDAAPLGFPQGPEDLLVDQDGQPTRIDHAFSWAYPLSAHGMLHSVIRNAWAADPYKIDTLFLFMANMSWNSGMASGEMQRMLADRNGAGDYRIPHLIYVDAYHSEMVNYADLILPDTTYLERHDCISILDRPISDADHVADAIRSPVVEPDRDVRPFQSVLLDLGARLGLGALCNADGSPRYPGGFADYMVQHERAPGLGLLAGWRADGQASGKGAPNPEQLAHYQAAGHFWKQEVPESARYYKMANADYLRWAESLGLLANRPLPESCSPQSGGLRPYVFQLYAEVLARFRNAARGFGDHQPPEALRERVLQYADPLPFWYAPFEGAQVDPDAFPLHAITQRPMFMYHAWGSQNRWLRQIAARNVLYVHPSTARDHGLKDGDMAELESHAGRIRMEIACHDGVAPHTVWTWNAIGKQKGAWALQDQAPESKRGFLLNPLIHDRTPNRQFINADPVTGQAAWFDLRVRLCRIKSD